MSDIEDAVAESQIKLKTVEKYKAKIADLTKELRAYLDQVSTSSRCTVSLFIDCHDIP